MKINELFPMLEDGWVWWNRTCKTWLYCPYEPEWSRYWKCYTAKTLEDSVEIPYPFNFKIEPPENIDEFVLIKIGKGRKQNDK